MPFGQLPVHATRLVEVAELSASLALLVVEFDGDYRLLATDGTAAGTVDLGLELASEPLPDSLSLGARRRLRGVIVRGGRALVRACTDASGEVIYSTDGTLPGTVVAEELVLGPDSDELGMLWPAAGGAVYIWRVSGIVRGLRYLPATGGPSTVLVAGTPSTFGRLDPIEVGGRLLFNWNAGGSGMNLWSTDGTAAGTGPLVDFGSTNTFGPAMLASNGSVAYFSAVTPSAGRELWKSDGTAAGTTQVVDLVPGAASGVFPGGGWNRGAAMIGNGVCFTARSTAGSPVVPWFSWHDPETESSRYASLVS